MIGSRLSRVREGSASNGFSNGSVGTARDGAKREGTERPGQQPRRSPVTSSSRSGCAVRRVLVLTEVFDLELGRVLVGEALVDVALDRRRWSPRSLTGAEAVEQLGHQPFDGHPADGRGCLKLAGQLSGDVGRWRCGAFVRGRPSR